MATATKFQPDFISKLKSNSVNKPSKFRPINEAMASPEVKPVYEVQYNIDSIEVCANGPRNAFNMPNATTVQVTSTHGEVLDRFQNRMPIVGQYGAHKLHVRTMNSGEKLLVEGSPYAYKYGQNTFTNRSMRRAAIIAMKSACKTIGYEPTKEQKAAWLAGDLELLRVDIAVNFKLESRAEVIEVLKQVRRQLIEQRGTTKTCETTVYWAPSDGKKYSTGLYAKGPQISRSKRYSKLPNKDKYLEECEYILRIEIRLRTPALAELGLSKVSDWGDNSARKAFNKYMARLKLFNITSGTLTDTEIEALPNRLRPVLALHKTGSDLKQVYPARTLQRHQSDFRKRGIDLKVPNQPAHTVRSLTKVLSPKNAIKETPAWMIEAGIAPPMSGKRKPQQKKTTSNSQQSGQINLT